MTLGIASPVGQAVAERTEAARDDPHSGPSSESPCSSAPRTALYAAAARCTQAWLWEPCGVAGRDYLLGERRIDRRVAVAAGVGYLPPGDAGLVAVLRRQGVSDGALVEASLATAYGARLRDRPAGGGYLVFAITAPDGRTMGLKMRAVPGVAREGAPRWLATAGSLEDAMFGWAQLPSGTRRVVAVEGEFDQLSVATALAYTDDPDLPPAIAVGGNQLAGARLLAIRQRFEHVSLLYDEDGGGRDGVASGGDALARSGLAVDVIRMPATLDVNDVLRLHGPAALADVLRASAEPLLVARASFARDAGDHARDPLFVARTLRCTAQALGTALSTDMITVAAEIADLPAHVIAPDGWMVRHLPRRVIATPIPHAGRFSLEDPATRQLDSAPTSLGVAP